MLGPGRSAGQHKFAAMFGARGAAALHDRDSASVSAIRAIELRGLKSDHNSQPHPHHTKTPPTPHKALSYPAWLFTDDTPPFSAMRRCVHCTAGACFFRIHLAFRMHLQLLFSHKRTCQLMQEDLKRSRNYCSGITPNSDASFTRRKVLHQGPWPWLTDLAA